MSRIRKFPLNATAIILVGIALLSIGGLKGRADTSAPALRRIRPDTISAEGPTFTVRLDGSGFQDGAQVLLDGVALPTSRVVNKGTLLYAEIDASLVATPGAHTVQGLNPDGGATETKSLTVVAADPDITVHLSGNSAEENLGAKLKIRINGEGFGENSTALVWGLETATTFINDTELVVSLPASLLVFPARIPIFVRNKGGSLSNYEIFFIVPQPAKISSITPDTLVVGTGPVKIDVIANNLQDGATLVVNGQPLPTATSDITTLTATIPADLISAPGQLIVRIAQGGTESKDMVLDVAPNTGPFVYTMAPSNVREDLKKPLVTLVGTNFDKGSTALIDGQMADVKSRTQQEIKIVLSSDLLAQLGSHTIQVMDSSGNPSNVGSFNVVADSDVTTASGGGGKHFGFNTTCAGAGSALYRGPRRLALGPDGLLYVTDQLNDAIRSVDPISGEVCTIAGDGFPGYNDSGNTAGFPVRFSDPNGIAVASDGTIYVTENGNSVIRRIVRNSDGTVTVDTFAGTSLPLSKSLQTGRESTLVGLPGQLDGAALQSLIRQPDDVIIGPDGTMYFSDASNEDVRRIVQTPSGPVVQTIAGSGVPGFADGDPRSARFNTPTGLALSPDGQFLYVADFGNDRIRKVTLSTGRVDTLSGSGDTGSADGPPGIATFDGPIGLAIDSDGTLYVSEFGNGDVRVVDPNGNTNTIAGSATHSKLRDGAGVRAKFKFPRGIAIDRVNRVLYVADFENFAIRRIQLP